ncbi:hypothetical protein FACS1894156_8840 [Bacteroidia bacterium]|nr:hypothetical protein FACS1894156_8840 [Bacteroidia bacterium]
MNYTKVACIIELSNLVSGADIRLQLNDDFFAQFEGSEVLGGQVEVAVSPRAVGKAWSLQVHLKGQVKLLCDRCLDEFLLPIDEEEEVRLCPAQNADEQQNAGDEQLFFTAQDTAVDLSQYLYESVCLSLPMQRFHARESDCNPQMLQKLKTLIVNLK